MKLILITSAATLFTALTAVAGPAPDPWTTALKQTQPPVHRVQGKMNMPTEGETFTIGDLQVSTPFAFATMPNAPVAGGFMTLTNTGTGDDRLVKVTSDAAARMEIHEMVMDGDVMKMRELEGGLPLPAGETIALQPGGYHVMFMDLAGPLAEGDTVAVTLTFESAGDVEIVMPVMPRMARGGHGQGHGAPSN